MFYFIFLVDDFVSESFVFMGVLDDILCVIYVVKGVLVLFVIYEYWVFFVWVKCSVGVFCWCLIVFWVYEGELNRLLIRNEE